MVAPNTNPSIILENGSAIGVDPQPNESANSSYFTADWSLTINAGLTNSRGENTSANSCNWTGASTSGLRSGGRADV